MIIPFVSGMITMGFLVGALFFARFWTRSRDLLFLAFSAAFCLLALNQALLTLGSVRRENQSWVYLLRLAAFLCIALAVIHKNTTSRDGS
jgi:hypothetical protein